MPDPHSLPPTPPVQPRPFERLAALASDLPKGCLAMIPVVSGMVHWGLLGVVLTMLCVLGGFWRVLALHGISRAGSADVLTRGWLGIAVTGSLAGLAAFAGRVGGQDGPLAEWTSAMDIAWRASSLLELLLAVCWIGVGAVQRGSRWMLLLLGLAGIAIVCSVGSQAVLAWRGQTLADQPAVVALLALLALGGGVAGPAIVADGCARLLQSMTGETLDEETDVDRDG